MEKYQIITYSKNYELDIWDNLITPVDSIPENGVKFGASIKTMVTAIERGCALSFDSKGSIIVQHSVTDKDGKFVEAKHLSTCVNNSTIRLNIN